MTWATTGIFGFDVARRQNRLMQFFQVAEGFQNQQVNAAFDQRRDLFAEMPRALPQTTVLPSGSMRMPSGPTAPATQASKLLAASRAKRAPAKIDVANFILQPVPLQAKRISAKGIGFNDLGPGLQVFMVNAANQVGLRNIQFVIAAVDEDALGIEQRAHGAIAEHGRRFNRSRKLCGMLFRIQERATPGMPLVKPSVHQWDARCRRGGPQSSLCYNPCSRIQ